MKIEFLSSNKRISGERRSKLLDPNSQLYQLLKLIQNKIDEEKIVNRSADRMDLHIELLSQREDLNNIKLQQDRIQKILQFDLDIDDPKSWGFINKAFCLFLPVIEGYNALPHITVLYLGNYTITPELLQFLREKVLEKISNYKL